MSMSESHIDQLNGYVYVCLSVSLTQIVLTPIATHYDNRFSGRVQNSSRAFNYPCSGINTRERGLETDHVRLFNSTVAKMYIRVSARNSPGNSRVMYNTPASRVRPFTFVL